MNRLKIGLQLESLGMPLRQALDEAARLGIRGIQIDAVGDLAPDHLSQTGRREFLHLLRSHDLVLTALGCPFRHGLDEERNHEGRIEHVKKVLSLSYDLGPGLVVVQAGQAPEKEEKGPRVDRLTEALGQLCRHGDQTGTRLALETGGETGQVLAQFLKGFDTGALGVTLDTANLLLRGLDPYQATRDLRGRICHAHAHDVRQIRANRLIEEVPVGQGDTDWIRLLGLLEEGEYRGWLILKRNPGSLQPGELENSLRFLRQLAG